MVADVLRKTLTRDQFENLQPEMGLKPIVNLSGVLRNKSTLTFI